MKASKSLASAKKKLGKTKRTAALVSRVVPLKVPMPAKRGAPTGPGFNPAELGARRYPEARYFKNGSSFLGYLEGRPFIAGISQVNPHKVDFEWKSDRHAPPPDVEERIEALPLVRELADPEERAAMLEAIRDAWEECDDGGAFVEVDLDYEEAAS